jgi:hypothetical protein
VDFESAVWRAIPEVFPDVTVRGCGFHWGQAVWRKIQEIGLQSSYNNDVGTRKFLRKELALPYVPVAHVQDLFTALKTEIENSPADLLQRLLQYAENTWITSDIWIPSAWNVFDRSIRTNNDVEGWHHRLNNKARKGNLNFYVLLQVIHDEASLVTLHAQLLSDRKVLRQQQKKYTDEHGCMVKLWEEFKAGKRSPASLLKVIAHHVAVHQCHIVYHPSSLNETLFPIGQFDPFYNMLFDNRIVLVVSFQA